MQRKNALVDAFWGFSSSTVNPQHLELARKCIEAGENRYDVLPFEDLLRRNEGKPNYHTVMNSAFDSIQKYVTNLLKPKRPPMWRSIKTNIAWYIAHVGCMDGAKDVLKIAGYSVESSDALEFPPHVEEPDKSTLFRLMAELVMAKIQVEMLAKQAAANRSQVQRSGPKPTTYVNVHQADAYQNNRESAAYGGSNQPLLGGSLEGGMDQPSHAERSATLRETSHAEKNYHNPEQVAVQRGGQYQASHQALTGRYSQDGHGVVDRRSAHSYHNVENRFESNFGHNSHAGSHHVPDSLAVNSLSSTNQSRHDSYEMQALSRYGQNGHVGHSPPSHNLPPPVAEEVFQPASPPVHHSSHPQKQLPSLGSCGSSGGDSSMDVHGSNETISPASSTEALPRTKSKGTDYKLELEAFRKRRQQTMMKPAISDVVPAVASSSDQLPKSKTISMGAAQPDSMSSVSHPRSISSTNSALPSSLGIDVLSPTSNAAIKRPPGKYQPDFYNDPILEGEESGAGLQDRKLESSAPEKVEPVMRRCISCSEVVSEKCNFCTACGMKQSLRRCVSCSEMLPDKGSFCPECGTKQPSPQSTGLACYSSSPTLTSKAPSPQSTGVADASSPRVIRASLKETSLAEQQHQKIFQLGDGETQPPEPSLPGEARYTSAGYDSSQQSGLDQLRLKQEALKRHMEAQKQNEARQGSEGLHGDSYGMKGEGQWQETNSSNSQPSLGDSQPRLASNYQAPRPGNSQVRRGNSELDKLRARREALRREQEEYAARRANPHPVESNLDQSKTAHGQSQQRESQAMGASLQEQDRGEEPGHTSMVTSHSSPASSRKGEGVEHLRQKEEAYKKFLNKQQEEELRRKDSLEQSGAVSMATGYSSPSSSRRGEWEGIELLRKKEEAYKKKQRQDGVREEDLRRLPELVEAENQEAERRRGQQMGLQPHAWNEGEAPQPKPRNLPPQQRPRNIQPTPREQIPVQTEPRDQAFPHREPIPSQSGPRKQGFSQREMTPPQPMPRLQKGMSQQQAKVAWQEEEGGTQEAVVSNGSSLECRPAEPPRPKPRQQPPVANHPQDMRNGEPQNPRAQPRQRGGGESNPRPQDQGNSSPGQQSFRRTNLLQNSYEQENDEDNRMIKLEQDGLSLLQCIKEGTAYYSIGEVHTAFIACKAKNRNSPPNWREVALYLDTKWANMTRVVRERVSEINHREGTSVGKPTEKEVREAMVDCRGDVQKTIHTIYKQREEKVRALLEKMQAIRVVEKTLPELEWNNAVLALSRNGMDVNDAFYALQTEWMQPLYEYVYSEYTRVTKTDMEEVKKILKNDDHYSLEARQRLLMAEYRFKEKFRAEMVLGLIEQTEGAGTQQSYPLNYYVDAAKDYDDLESASNFLNKECPICMEIIPVHEMVTMPGCTDSLCKNCFSDHFKIVIKEQGVKHFNCPSCSLPNMMDPEATEGLYVQLFVEMIKEYLGRDNYRLCMDKLNEFSLTKEPGFMWCPFNDCGAGFIYDAAAARNPREITCPNCKKKLCLVCKKPWEEQHAGITCDQFAQWKQANDPDAQKQGLAAHLNANGIECPQCHMRYDLARGGCMHFRCTRCPNEFCSGCGQSFKQGQQCGKLKSCEKKGLHAHHPRDCLFYMRDFDVKELQDFLQKNKIQFDVDPPKEQVKAARRKMKGEGDEAEDKADDEEEVEMGGADVKLQCRVMLQKETPEGLKDEECGSQVEDGQAGLCKTHYKEYLVDKINKDKLDPVTMYETKKIEIMLTREELELPPLEDEEEAEETPEELRERLIKHVQQVLPLDTRPPTAGTGPPPAAQPPQAPPPADNLRVVDLEDADLAPPE